MKKLALFALLLVAAMVPQESAQGVVVDLFRYDLGEPGSFSGQLPQDGVGSLHQTNALGTITPGGVLDTAAPWSSSATQYQPSATAIGSYGAISAGLPSDNFGIEVWVRASDVSQPILNDFLAMNGATPGSVTFGILNGNWAAHYYFVDWVGEDAGIGQTAEEDIWTNLAIIRENGISTFYIDGVAQPGTTALAPTFGTDPFGIHVGVQPGGARWFEGDLDAVRMFSFDPNTDDPVRALSINQVPEPTSIAIWSLFALGACGLAWRKSRKRRAGM